MDVVGIAGLEDEDERDNFDAKLAPVYIVA